MSSRSETAVLTLTVKVEADVSREGYLYESWMHLPQASLQSEQQSGEAVCLQLEAGLLHLYAALAKHR